MNDRTEAQHADAQTETAGVRAIDRSIEQIEKNRDNLRARVEDMDAESKRLRVAIADNDNELRALRRARVRLIHAEQDAAENLDAVLDDLDEA